MLREFPYERDAIADRPMPKGLPLYDQLNYRMLCDLYRRHRERRITTDEATAEKKEFIRAYEIYETYDIMCKRYVDLIKNTEDARCRYRKERTLENADNLLAAIDGRMNNYETDRSETI